MSVFQDILKALGLASYDDQSTTPVPVVTVKIVDSLPLGLSKGETMTISQLAAKVGVADTAPEVTKISNAYASAVFSRMLEPADPADVDAFVNAAKLNDPTYEPPNFNNFLVIVCPPGFDTDALVAAFQAWTSVVEFAGRNPVPQVASVTGTQNQYYTSEQYLSAPNGVNAPAAWAKGADGTGIRVVDVENGWFLAHQDLPTGIPLYWGVNNSDLEHGTATLGVIAAQDNNVGVVGLAPNAAIKVASTAYRVNSGPNSGKLAVSTANAIYQAAAFGMSSGDVLLMEVQFPGSGAFLPAEVSWPVFQVIRLVTSGGIVVVEPAGNGSTNLDTYVDTKGKHIFDRSKLGEFQDSGAIMVAAGSSTKSPIRLSTTGYNVTNYGSRIDCCAWGDSVATCRYDPKSPNTINLYLVGPDPLKDYFKYTSAAGAIIAGCCALTQHLQLLLTPKNTPGRLNSRQMRALLSNPANCSPLGAAKGAPGGDIGAMPDFALIIANEYQP